MVIFTGKLVSSYIDYLATTKRKPKKIKKIHKRTKLAFCLGKTNTPMKQNHNRESKWAFWTAVYGTSWPISGDPKIQYSKTNSE